MFCVISRRLALASSAALSLPRSILIETFVTVYEGLGFPCRGWISLFRYKYVAVGLRTAFRTSMPEAKLKLLGAIPMASETQQNQNSAVRRIVSFFSRARVRLVSC